MCVCVCIIIIIISSSSSTCSSSSSSSSSSIVVVVVVVYSLINYNVKMLLQQLLVCPVLLIHPSRFLLGILHSQVS